MAMSSKKIVIHSTMSKFRFYLILIILVNVCFLCVMGNKQKIVVALVGNEGPTDFYPYALHTEVNKTTGDEFLVSFGAPVKTIEYTPFFIFRHNQDWTISELTFCSEVLFFTIHPIVSYDEVTGLKYVYRLYEPNCKIYSPVL